MVGERLGKFKIIKKIGKGGMGTVYLAVDEILGRYVALKVISQELSQSENIMKRFEVEAIAQARLNHENIISIYSYKVVEGTHFIVMEYVEGKSLKDLLREEGYLDIKKALEIFIGILSAIDYAHKKGVIHRDIKPSNIIVPPDGIPKIGDFGIAKVKGIEGLTREGSVLGTPVYSSPEQISGGKITYKTDIYSLGVLLYEMLTGSPPFVNEKKDSLLDVAEKKLKEKPGKPSSINPEIPDKLDKIILKALEKSPDKRYSSVEEFKECVVDFLKEFSKNKKGVSKMKSVSSNSSRNNFILLFKKRRKLFILSIFMMFLILILVSVIFITTTQPTTKNVYATSKRGYIPIENELPPGFSPGKKVVVGVVKEENEKNDSSQKPVHKNFSKKSSFNILSSVRKLDEYFSKKEYSKMASYGEALIKKGIVDYSIYVRTARAYLFLKNFNEAKKFYSKCFKMFSKVEFIAKYRGKKGLLVVKGNTLYFTSEKNSSKKENSLKFKLKDIDFKVKKPYLLSKHRLYILLGKKKFEIKLKANSKEQVKFIKTIIENIRGGIL